MGGWCVCGMRFGVGSFGLLLALLYSDLSMLFTVWVAVFRRVVVVCDLMDCDCVKCDAVPGGCCLLC